MRKPKKVKVEVSMTSDHMFEANHWWAKSPDFVVSTLKAHLEAAAAIWPELRNYELKEKRHALKPGNAQV